MVKALYFFRIPHLLHYLNKKAGKVPILLFHDINPVRNDLTGSITPEEFEAMIVFLKAKYKIESLDFDSECLNANACYITFDDGMYNFLRYAAPIIEKHRIPVTLFVPPDGIDKKYIWTLKFFQMVSTKKIQWKEIVKSEMNEILSQISHDDSDINDEFRLMNWEELNQLDFSLINIQSHTNSHSFLTELSTEKIEQELEDSKTRLESNINGGIAVRAVSYPFGDHDEKVVTLASKNYSHGFITEDRMVDVNWLEKRFEIPRFHIHRGSLMELYLKINGLVSYFKG